MSEFWTKELLYWAFFGLFLQWWFWSLVVLLDLKGKELFLAF
jgi:hypothetical protein